MSEITIGKQVMVDVRAGALRKVVIVLFLASGFSGLVYQVAWVRLLTPVFGVTAYAISTVIASFMGGLALGSFVAGGGVGRGGGGARGGAGGGVGSGGG